MTERADLPCGCAYVKAGPKWYQVVACPEHQMNMAPHDDPPVPALRATAPRGWIAEGVILSPCCDLWFDFCGTPQELQEFIDAHHCIKEGQPQ